MSKTRSSGGDTRASFKRNSKFRKMAKLNASDSQIPFTVYRQYELTTSWTLVLCLNV